MPTADRSAPVPPTTMISRRGALRVLGVGAGGWTAAMLVAAPPAHAGGIVPAGVAVDGPDLGALVPEAETVVDIPRTLAATSVGLGPASPVFPPSFVAVRWCGPAGPGGPRIRLRRPDGAFGAWCPLSVGCPAERDDPSTTVPPVHALLATARTGSGRTPTTRGYELWMPPGATGVVSTALNTTSGPCQRVRVPTVSVRAALSAVAGLAHALETPAGTGRSGPGPARTAPRTAQRSPLSAGDVPGATAGPLVPAPTAAAPTPSALGLRYLPRAAWGADESLRLNPATGQPWRTTYYPGQVVTVHHTVTPNDDPDPAGTVRAIYHFHTVDRGWADIGYHFLIDEQGTLYEGRWSGSDTVPAHRPDGQVVTGAHVGGYNAGNLGVALLGDLRTRPPSAAARRSLVLVLLALTGAHRLNPVGTVDYVNAASGARRRVPAISGHRDWMATECPGGAAYSALARIRLDVARASL